MVGDPLLQPTSEPIALRLLSPQPAKICFLLLLFAIAFFLEQDRISVYACANVEQRFHVRHDVVAIEWELRRCGGHSRIIEWAESSCKMAASASAGKKDHVLSAAVRRAVEPAVAGLDGEAGFLEKLLPFVA